MMASWRLAETAFIIQSGSGRYDVNETLEVIGVVSFATSGTTSGMTIVGATGLIETGGNVVTEEIVGVCWVVIADTH
jgi:hypothetical protein